MANDHAAARVRIESKSQLRNARCLRGNFERSSMAVQFRDYYETLGVSKTASDDEIRSARSASSRANIHPECQPKDKATAEEKFKQINEAYEVLSDPEKRRKYDQLGADWNQPGGFQPPPGWGGAATRRRFPALRRRNGGGLNSNSAAPGSAISSKRSSVADVDESASAADLAATGAGAERGSDVEADIMVTLEEALHGSKRTVSLRRSIRRTRSKRIR